MQKGLINVGQYSDGSGPVVTVKFDVTSATCRNSIWIETGENNWLAVDAEFSDELCRAIKTAARSIRKATA